MVAFPFVALCFPLSKKARKRHGRDNEEASCRQGMQRALQAECGSLISQRSGFNCQPIAEKGRASGPLGGDSAVVQSRLQVQNENDTI